MKDWIIGLLDYWKNKDKRLKEKDNSGIDRIRRLKPVESQKSKGQKSKEKKEATNARIKDEYTNDPKIFRQNQIRF